MGATCGHFMGDVAYFFKKNIFMGLPKSQTTFPRNHQKLWENCYIENNY